MQNRYVGDVADFGKHGLLRFLIGMTDPENAPRLRLGLIWYMHHDERHGADKKKINYDGGEIGYLALTRNNVKDYGSCDSELWSRLGHLVGQDRRCVHCAEGAGILPDDTLYYGALLAYIPGMPSPRKAEYRQAWLNGALRETRNADMVCVDPDTGIGNPANMFDPAKGAKYTYMSDLQAMWERQQSLVVYQHVDRNGDTYAQVRREMDMLRDGLENAEPIPLVFHRGSARIYYVIPAGDRAALIADRVARFLARGWERHGHFELVR